MACRPSEMTQSDYKIYYSSFIHIPIIFPLPSANFEIQIYDFYLIIEIDFSIACNNYIKISVKNNVNSVHF